VLAKAVPLKVTRKRLIVTVKWNLNWRFENNWQKLLLAAGSIFRVMGDHSQNLYAAAANIE
jgi:hypothetical protein